MTGQVAAIVRSHMNGSISFERTIKQTTETMPASPKTVTAATIRKQQQFTRAATFLLLFHVISHSHPATAFWLGGPARSKIACFSLFQQNSCSFPIFLSSIAELAPLGFHCHFELIFYQFALFSEFGKVFKSQTRINDVTCNMFL